MPHDFEKGDRVELVHTNDPYTNLQPGSRGVVIGVHEQFGEVTYWMKWDNGSTLSMIPDSGDVIVKVAAEA